MLMRLFTTIAWSRALLAVLAANGLCLITRASTAESYSPPPFDHYQPILDRMPFGALPANFNGAVDPAAAKAEAQVKAEQQALAKKVNMSAVNVTPDGSTAIGFTDLSVNPPVNYYVRVGGSSGGWNVLSADYDAETASIEKDGVTITLKLGQGLIDNPTNAPIASARPSALTPRASDAPSPPPFGIRRPPSANPQLEKPKALSFNPLRKGGVPEEAATQSSGERDKADASASGLSYAERLRERNTQKTQAQLEAEAKLKAQFEKLARETAAREIQRREEEAAMAIQQQSDEQQQTQEEQAAPEEEPAEQPGDGQ